jgi:hypothetical protein
MGSFLNLKNFESEDGLYEASGTFNRTGVDARVIPFWYKYGGITTPRYPTTNFHFKRLCQIPEIANFVTEFSDDNETVEVGKRTTRTNSGKTITSTVTFKGNDISGLLAMIGRHPHNRSASSVDIQGAIEIGRDYGVQGALVMIHQSENQEAMGGEILTDVGVRVLESPGASDGETTYNVEIYSKGELFRFSGGFLPAVFSFYDNGISGGIANTAAPDGTLTAFAVKDANGAFSSVPSYGLLAQKVRPEASTALNQYVIECRKGTAGQVNSKVGNSAVTFAPATSTFTFGAAPSDGEYFEGIILLPSGFPDWEDWRTYHSNDVVKNSDKYWVCTPASGSVTIEEPTGTPTDWTEIADQQFEVPYFSHATAWNGNSAHRETNALSYAGLSWTDFMYY